MKEKSVYLVWNACVGQPNNWTEFIFPRPENVDCFSCSTQLEMQIARTQTSSNCLFPSLPLVSLVYSCCRVFVCVRCHRTTIANCDIQLKIEWNSTLAKNIYYKLGITHERTGAALIHTTKRALEMCWMNLTKRHPHAMKWAYTCVCKSACFSPNPFSPSPPGCFSGTKQFYHPYEWASIARVLFCSTLLEWVILSDKRFKRVLLWRRR